VLSSSLITSNTLCQSVFAVFASFLLVFACFQRFKMTETSETSSAIVARLFRAPDALLGSEWLDSVASGWTDTSLHRHVIESGTLSATKTKELYGHFITKTAMKGTTGTYWLQKPQDTVREEAKRLNVPVVDTQKRLQQLRTDKIGGILLVTQIMTSDGMGIPFITVLAAPSLATVNLQTGDAGVLLEDIWDDTILSAFKPDLVMSDVHCPLIGAQEGFSRSLKVDPKVISLLQDGYPLFLPEGELTCTMVTHGDMTLPRAIFLPEVCNLPIGMRWPVSIGLQEFLSSIQGAYGQASGNFHQTLKALDPTISQWFAAVKTEASLFVIRSCSFLQTYDVGFPAIDSGQNPETILDNEGFSPLTDMLNGHVWRLWCDRILTTDTRMNRTHLKKYLALGESAITADTYLGVAIPGRFCPNYAYHFKVVNGWPTDTQDKSFLGEFQHLPMISYQAQQYDPVDVDVHQPEIRVPPLKTREECTSAIHESRTPKFSYPKKSPLDMLIPETPNGRNKLQTARTKPSTPISIPSTTKTYNPSPRGHTRMPLMATTSAQRRLDDELLAQTSPALDPRKKDQDLALASAKTTRYDPLTATVNTAEGRLVATDIYLNICRLLAHHSTTRQLTVGNDQILPASIIYVREPCTLFRREILNHLSKYASNSGYMPPFSSFMEAMLRPVQIYVNGVFDPNFFTGVFLHTFFSVESWMVNDHILPANVPDATFHVYRLIACLPAHAGHSLNLPENGLTLLEAKHLGVLTYYLFAMMDLTDGTFSDEKFALSILGQRLKAWSCLPDSATIHGLWNQSPLQATYQWFASLQSLLSTMQLWVKRLRYHPERGFYHARDNTGRRYLMLDSQIPSNIPGRTDSLIEALSHYDHAFETRWFRSSFMDPIWTTPLPPGHCITPRSNNRDRGNPGDNGRNPDPKRQKLGGGRIKNPDFINKSPPMECTFTMPAQKSVLQALYGKFHAPVAYPRFPTSTGTLQTLCLNSSFVSPHNTCTTRLCGDRKSGTRMLRLHMDLSQEEWRKKPEAYWAPLIAFLRHPEVTPHIRPTQAFKSLTPSTTWT
jgi:hypothetical protein